jgi:teichuronic acid biosynthesis glycosyltransferase TuaH
MRVVLISLEPWDDVWRRNQHLSTELIRQGIISDLWFVEPARRGRRSTSIRAVRPGVVAVSPGSPLPKSLGGLIHLGRYLAQRIVRGSDLLWINDPALGVQCLTRGTPTIYDVTDDWRAAGFPPRITRRIVRAEDRLAVRARTIVCSYELRRRWEARYGVDAPVVQNAVDSRAWSSAEPIHLPSEGPHVGYVGTLHEQRLDLDLVADLAGCPEIGTLHLVGPDCLSDAHSRWLRQLPRVRVHGPVESAQVPAWMKAMDVLISPHLVNDFTLSLDAIKAHEYAASGRPVVATATSGFQEAATSSVRVAPANEFAVAVLASLASPGPVTPVPVATWSDRAAEFWSVVEQSTSLAGATT